MCGIAGLVSERPEQMRERLARMAGSLAHRGPDDAGIVQEGGVGLVHRRLAVIDLTTNGRQPMANEDGSVWITYNGEVYGTAMLRRDLESRGHRFRSRTDTEVILHLYEEEGTGLFRHLNGMFAFAIHDRARRRLLLARDRLGIKPLYYGYLDGMLLFASELKGIFAALSRSPSLRPIALGQYLLQGYVSAPDTVFEGIYTLPGGHFVDLDLRNFNTDLREPTEYWDAPFTGDGSGSAEAICAELRPLLLDAVQDCLVSDAPLGAFLSGGIDSSTVVAAVAQSRREPIRTFSVALPGTDRDESAKARAVAHRWATVHTEIDATEDHGEDYWKCLAHFDAPFNCASLLNATRISTAARRHVTVALSGDGGDELFGGYTRYLRVASGFGLRDARPMWSAIAAVLPEDLRGRARVAHRAEDEFMRYLCIEHPLPIGTAERLAGTGLNGWLERMRAIYERYPADPLTRAMYFDLKTYLPDHILAKVDSASMAVALEVRVPLLDHRLVELAGRIPSALKVKGGRGKRILKKAVGSWLPDELLSQPKVGFDPPLASWLFEAHLNRCLDELSSRDARFRCVLDGAIVDRWIRTLRETSRWRVPRRAALWSVYQLERWLRLTDARAVPTRAAVGCAS